MLQHETFQGWTPKISDVPPVPPRDLAIAESPSRWEGLLPWQARRVSTYVDDHLADRVLLSDAAARAKLSPGYFSRRFRKSFGLTFPRFVAHRRIEQAQAMMIESTSGLCQIALACGFADQPHFTRTFVGVTGSTPSQWRRAAASRDLFCAITSCQAA